MRTTAPQQTANGQARSAIAPRTGQYVQVPNRAELAPLGLQAEDIHQSESKLGSSASEASEHHDSSEALRLSYNFGQIPIFSAIASSAKENLVSPVLDATYTSKEDCRTRRLQLNAIATSATLIDTASMQSAFCAGVRWPVARHNRSDGIPYRAHMERVFGADFSTVQSIRGESDLLTSLGARAAAWPETVAFASETPHPRVVAHELAHVLQYRNVPADSMARHGIAMRADPAEAEARRATNQLDAGFLPDLEVRPSSGMMLYTDEEDFDSVEFLQERPPNFTNQEVGSWGQSLPATLVARERLDVSFPEAERSDAIIEAIFRREPLVIMHEYHRLWLYRLEWEGLSARYSRFTNSSTMFSQAPEESGGYAVSNVMGRPEVEAFVTEDGGVLSPPGAGKLFSHTGGEFEDPLVSGFENAVAFIGGLEKGLENADVAGLAEQLGDMAALNTVFPAPFAAGAVHGVANEIVELAKWLDPRQWQAIEAAARQTILILSDPDGEELATALGEEFGRTQAAALEKLLQKSLIVFAYEVGKLVGPTLVEVVLAFIGIQVGPAAIIHKALDLVEEAPNLSDVLRAARNVFPEIPERPGFPPRVGEDVIEELPSTKALPDVHDGGLGVPADTTLPDLSSDEQKLLAATGDLIKYPGTLPKNLADQELDIVKRAKKSPIKDSGDGYINEVDLRNGHRWKEKLDGTWCRFSNGGTNCTRVILTLGAQPPATVVATATRKSLLREVYFEWAANRAPDNVEVALAFHKASGTYAVVVGDDGYVRLPNNGEGWITIAHSHPGAPNQPGVINPSPWDLEVSLIGSFDRDTKRIRKWVHSQTPEGEWQEVEYGLDLETERYYVQPTGREPMYFDELQDPRLEDSGLIHELQELDEELRIQRLAGESAEEYYQGWWARQFVWDD